MGNNSNARQYVQTRLAVLQDALESAAHAESFAVEDYITDNEQGNNACHWQVGEIVYWEASDLATSSLSMIPYLPLSV